MAPAGILDDKVRLTALLSALAVTIMGAAFLAAWLLAPHALGEARGSSIYPISIPAATAFCLLGAGVFIVAIRTRRGIITYAPVVAGALALLISLAVILDSINSNLALGSWMLPASTTQINGLPANLTSPDTAMSIIIACLSLILLSATGKFPQMGRTAVILALLVGLNGLVVFISFIYGMPLRHNGVIIPMSLDSSIVFILISTALVSAADPRFWLIDITAPTLKARLLRTFLPLVLLLVFLEGWALQESDRLLPYMNPATVSSVLALVFLLVAGLIVVRIARHVGEAVDRAFYARMEAEESLRSSEHRYRDLFEESPVSIWEEDYSSVKSYLDTLGLKDYDAMDRYFDENPDELWRCLSLIRIVDVNARSLEMYGAASKNELIDNPSRTFAEESLPALKSSLLRAMTGEKNFEIETVTSTLDGEKLNNIFRWSVVSDFEDDLSKVLVSVSDITERKRTEEQMRFMQFSLEHSADAAFWVDTEARLIFVNQAACDRLGYSREELLGMTVHDIDPNFPRSAWLNHWREVKDKESVTLLSTHKRSDGSTYPVEITTNHLSYEGREYHCSFARDVTERMATENALTESEHKYRTLVQNMDAIVYLVALGEDPSNNRVTFISDRIEDITGYRPVDFINNGGLWYSLIHPEDVAEVNAFVDEVLTKKQNVFCSYRMLNRSKGEYRWLDDSVVPQFDENGEVNRIMGVARDVTEHRAAEERIKESEKRFRDLFEGAPDAIFLADPETGMIIGANEEAARLMGRSRQEIVGMNQSELHPRGRDTGSEELFARHVHESVNRGTTRPLESLVVRANGEEVPVEIVSQMIEAEGEQIFQGIFRDISSRKKAEAALTVSEENYRRMFDMSPIGFAVHQKGVVVRANQAAARIIGAESPDELIGRKVIEFVHPDFRKLVAERMTQVLELDIPLPFKEEKFLQLDGKTVDVEVASMPIVFEGEKATLVAVQAIMERKLLEEQLVQAQKMEGIGSLAGGIAHDFNNYLTAIQGYIDLSLMALPPDSTVYEELKEARRSSQRAADLTRQLLLFSRREPMDLKPTDLSRVVKDMQNMLERLIGERYILRIELKENIWTVKGDPGHLQQVIMNLVVNARDAMPEGGEIVISTGNMQVEENYTRTQSKANAGDFVFLEVRDTGVGIDEEALSHIFEPFFSTKKDEGGTGLGLPVVYGIVSQHGGWIDVDTIPGKGTSFRAFIPAVAVVAESEVEGDEDFAQARGHGQRVLLVEDERAIRTLAERMLNDNGYQVFPAAGAEEAMGIFDQEGGSFDLVFSDVILPGEDGVELVGRLHERNPELKVMLASGYSGDSTRHVEIERSGYRFLQKPYTLTDLVKTVHELLNNAPE